jgi:4'-phosphopantetheinyl transferase
MSSNSEANAQLPSSRLPLPDLSDGDVHVWRSSLDRPAAEVRLLEALLSEDEVARVGRFRLERDRRRYIVGRATLRAILGGYLGLPPKQMEFAYGPQGKPALHARWAETQITFNLSHARELAIYAVTKGREVGIDLEWIEPGVDVEPLAERFLSAREKASLYGLPRDQAQARFYMLWTRKEALLKAMGVGLSAPLDHFSVLGLPESAEVVLSLPTDRGIPQRWSLHRLRAGPGYEAALAVEGKINALTFLRYPCSHYRAPGSALFCLP